MPQAQGFSKIQPLAFSRRAIRRRSMNTSVSPEHGIVKLPSPHSVEQTARRLAGVFEQAGMTVFAQIDQQRAAEAVGLTMRPMILMLFGNPKGGTPLMEAYPSLAIDLPLKALVWEDAGGRVWVSMNSPEYLRQRHAMADAPFTAVQAVVERALK
jgi:uncharacterized protein (DUF302 family)